MKRALLALLLALAGCHEGATEMLVVVNQYGLTVGRDIDGLQIVVRTHATDTDPIFSTDQHLLCPESGAQPTDCWTLPLLATLVPGPHQPDDQVVVDVLGLRNHAQVIGDQATFHFISHESQRLDFVLSGNCLGVDCTASDQACYIDGSCQPLQPTRFTGSPQLDGPPGGFLADLSEPRTDLAGIDLNGLDLARGLNPPPHDLAGADLTATTDAAMPEIWTPQSSGNNYILNGVWGSDARNLYVVGNAGFIVHTTDGGTSWTTEGGGVTSQNLNAVWGANGVVYAVGDGGTILQRGGSVTWTVMSTPWTLPPIALHGIWGDNPSDFYVVGDQSVFGHWDGINWTELCGSLSGPVFSGAAVWGRSVTDVYVAGAMGPSGGYVGHSTADPTCTGPTGVTGPTGGPTPSGSGSGCISGSCPLVQFSGASSDVEYGVSGAAGDLGVKVVSNAGDIRDCSSQVSSCTLDVQTAGALRSVWVDSGGAIAIAVGAAGSILRSESGSWAHEVSGTDQPLNAVWGVSGGGPAWAVGNNGVILKRP